ncbi:hypothetical protein [uncultured Fibrobacter sp.]|uniref:hypothetical protein n=1 Tax=uncultured Fibrobacter sp. TaxID=261512 RepID=UPI00260FEE55|nr:hypothetical protein [uncultured Fibrobacter sp.]
MRLISIFPYAYILGWIFLSFLPYVYYSTKAYVALLFFLAILALSYTIYFVANYRLIPFFKGLLVFVGFLSVYGLIHLVVSDPIFCIAGDTYIETNRYLLWLFNSMLTVVPIYIFTCKGLLNERIMKILFFVILGASILAFHVTYQQMLLEAALIDSIQEEFTITTIYILLSILPLVFLFKKQIFLQFLLLVVFFIFFILSAKRGVILLGSISILFIMWGILSEYSIRKKTIFCLVSVLVLIGLYQFTMHQLETSSYLAGRYQDTLDGYSSQRDVYLATIFNYMENNFSIRSFLFGIGAQGTLSVNVSFAHNDWVAILLEQGVIGLLSYVLFWIGFLYTWIKSWNHSRESFVAIGSLVIIGFGKTFFSMFYLPIAEGVIIASGFYAIALGYYLGKTFPQYSTEQIRNIKLRRKMIG